MAGISPESKSEEPDEESNEITLRPIALSDIDDFMVWATDDRVSHFCLWDTYTSKHEAFQFINDVAIPHPWFRVICINNRAVGSISVTPGSGKVLPFVCIFVFVLVLCTNNNTWTGREMTEARKRGKISAKITLTVIEAAFPF